MSRSFWLAAALVAAVYVLLLCAPAWSHGDLGYPIPQEKPCRAYWDSRKAQNKVAAAPNVLKYAAGKNDVIALLKPPEGMEHLGPYVFRFSHDKRGCVVSKLYVGRAAIPYALPLAPRQDDA